MADFTFNTTPSIVLSSGGASCIAEICGARLGRTLLIVTDKGILDAGLLEPALASLRKADIQVAIFGDVTADPPEHIVLEAVSRAREVMATGVIGFGGGSSLDVAKLVALLATGDQDLADVYGINVAYGPRLPLLLVPTTAGTGSEVTPISIVTTGLHEKKGVVSPVLIPDIALLDPDLTLSLPAHVTAATGIDAMVHAIEAYTSTSSNNNPVSAMLAREAIRLLARNIRIAVGDGGNRDARANMLLGSFLAGQAFANSPVAAVHALAYPIGGHFGVPHGLSNALVLPHVLEFNLSACGPSYAELAPLVDARLDKAPAAECMAAFPCLFRQLGAHIGLPSRLRDVGIPSSAIEMLARDAIKQTRLLGNNPRPVGLEDARQIYEAAW